MKALPALFVLAFVFSLCNLSNVRNKNSSNSNSGDFEDDSISDCNSGNEEDDGWCRRLKIARMKSQPAHVPVAEIPDDPKVSNIYDDPVVFVKTQLYIYTSSQAMTLPGYGDTYRDTQKYFFLATGRFYYKNTTYEGQTTPAGKVAEIWGRYHFTKSDEMELETDAGEKLTFPMKFGRRNLIWDEITFLQVDWANESLQKELNQ